MTEILFARPQHDIVMGVTYMPMHRNRGERWGKEGGWERGEIVLWSGCIRNIVIICLINRK